MDKKGAIDPVHLDAVARMGNNWYSRANGDALFEITKPGRNLGIGIDALPAPIRNSKILSGNDLGRLGILETFPSEADLEQLRQEEVIQALIKTQAPEDQWHVLARQLIGREQREKALGILMIGLEVEAR